MMPSTLLYTDLLLLKPNFCLNFQNNSICACLTWTEMGLSITIYCQDATMLETQLHIQILEQHAILELLATQIPLELE
jgi:hypothetical protein